MALSVVFLSLSTAIVGTVYVAALHDVSATQALALYVSIGMLSMSACLLSLGVAKQP